jgi:membrane protein YdbS with pleckstrin-like domain
MEAIKIKPEKELKTLWLITWAVCFVVVAIPILLLFLFEVELWIILTAIFILILISIPVIVWINAAFNAIEYCIDDEGVKMKGGVVWRKHVTVPYSKITNVDITRGPMQRYFNIGTIHVQTAGAGGQQGQKAELKINGVREIERIRDILFKKVKDVSYPLSNAGGGEEKIKQGESGSTQFNTQVSAQISAQVFEDILNELREIKKLLEKDKKISG